MAKVYKFVISDVILNELKQRGWSLYRLQKEMEQRGHDITLQTISNAKNGKPVKADTLMRIMDTLDWEMSKRQGGK